MERNSTIYYLQIYDIIIIAPAVKDIEVMLQELDNASRKKCGLKMNRRKTKITEGTTRTIKAVYVNGIQLDQVEDYVCLLAGQLLH